MRVFALDPSGTEHRMIVNSAIEAVALCNALSLSGWVTHIVV